MILIKNMISRWTLFPVIILSAALTIGLTGCNIFGSDDDDGNGGGGGNGNQSDPTVVQTMEEQDDLSTFSQALSDAGLQGTYEADGSFTIFAPTNAAFEALGDMLGGLTQEQLAEIINYHIIASKIVSGDLGDNQSIQTAQEDSIYVRFKGDDIELNGGAFITEADIEASNGVIHKVDQVLLPDAYLNVFEIADKRYYTSTFVCHCTSGRTNFEAVLSNPDAEFTVFVPTNVAFNATEINAEFPADDVLRDILEYHVVEGSILSGDLSNGQTLTTMHGTDITVSVADGVISLNGGASTVQVADLEGTNGVVYIIDAVLTPPGM